MVGIEAKIGAPLVAVFSIGLLLCAGTGRAGVATVVGSLPSPLPTPRFDLGFELSADSYWVLGPTASADEIVQIDRASLTVVDHFVLPGSSGQTYRGLARDPDTGIFYSNFNDEEVRALTLPEPGAAAGVVALATLALGARRRG